MTMDESTLKAALELEEEPAEDPAEEQGTPAEQPEEKQEDKQEQSKEEQSREERARQAHGRRIREAEEAGRRAAREELSATISRLGLKDPKTGKPVDTVEALEAYERSQSDERLAAGQGTADDIRRIVREETRQRPAEDPMQDPRVKEQLAQIRAMDPEMTDLDAILASEVGEKFRGYVQRGLDFVDAYTLAAKDRLSKRAEEAARTKAASKDHLQGTQSRGAGSVSVPAAVMEEYRLFMPDATEAEIVKHYNQDLKRVRR